MLVLRTNCINISISQPLSYTTNLSGNIMVLTSYMNNNLVKYKPVNEVVSHSVILPPTVSGLWLVHWQLMRHTVSRFT